MVLPPVESESEPQAERARAVVARAATAIARVRSMLVLSRVPDPWWAPDREGVQVILPPERATCVTPG
ncbi:hypothetical protein PDTK01_23040 [Phycicoccus sp. DTK01]|nr:hypothetical protein PDTK01_23040 [Phycicoccus sp. DTK01]